MGLALILAISILVHALQDAGARQLVIDRVTEGNRAQHARADTFEDAYRDAIALAASLDLAQMPDLGDYLALAHHGVAVAERDRGEIERAIFRVQKAEADLPLSPPFRSILLSLNGDLLLELGLPDRADAPIRRAFELARVDLAGEAPNWGGIFLAYARRFKLHLATERYRDAARLVEKLKGELDWDAVFEGRDPVRAARERATLDAYAGVAWAALAVREPGVEPQARAALERVRAEPRASPADRFTAGARLALLALRREEPALAAELVSKLRPEWDAVMDVSLAREEEAWLAAIEARIAETTGEDREEALDRLGRSFRALMEERRTVARFGGVGYFRYGRARMLLEELVALSTPEEALGWMLEAHALGTLWRELGRPEPSTRDLIDALAAPGTGCIVFVNGESRAQSLVIDEHGKVQRFELGPAHVVMDLSRKYLAVLQKDPSLGGARRRGELDEIGRTLASTLFPKSVREAIARWKYVRIAGRDLIEDLALEGLPVIDGKPFGVTHAVSDLPSLTVAFGLAERPARSADGDAVLFVDPAVAQSAKVRFTLADLEIRPDTLDALRAAADSPLRIVREEHATIAALEDAAVARARWLHVFAHGVLDDTRELRTIVVLAPDAEHADGYLTVEIARTLHAPELVVLSVCRSGDSAERTGDSGAGHLGGAFLIAGARCVLLSPEQVRLSAAVAMSEVLYAALDEGCSPAEALRRARAALAADERWADPFHWALVRAYGFDVPRSKD